MRFSSFRLVLLSLLTATIFGLLSLFFLIKFSRQSINAHREQFLISIANVIETLPPEHAFDSLPLHHGHFGDPHFPPPRGGPDLRFPPPPGEPRHNDRPDGDRPDGERPDGERPRGERSTDVDHGVPLHPPPDFPHPRMWIINEARAVVAVSANEDQPPDFKTLPLPSVVHRISSDDSFFQMRAPTLVIRLDTSPATFLVQQEPIEGFRNPIFRSQLLFSFASVMISVFLSLLMTFFYLKYKSSEAKAVLHRLEKGDLKARFKIRRVDEFGSLMLDFNRMANEIERLVSRIHETEKTRKNLLQELGHDLRTPLTSISAAFETFQHHFDKMSLAQRGETFELVQTEIAYFKELLDKLMTIASLDEPHYKNSAQLISISHLLAQEVKSRHHDRIQYHYSAPAGDQDAIAIFGDVHLILRLIKNAIDNATRFAATTVDVALAVENDKVLITVTDDGPGLSPADFQNFGKRRETRQPVLNSPIGFSIGLGSVIMKTIAQLHGGQIEIKNREQNGKVQGAILTVTFPKTDGRETV